jgi:plasmid maintenance system antidote protein VapI
VALRLARLVGGSATLWLSLQQKHDLATLERTMADELDKIEPAAG